jgi:hypothetical protein
VKYIYEKTYYDVFKKYIGLVTALSNVHTIGSYEKHELEQKKLKKNMETEQVSQSH